jgi:hypothetical protein
MPPQTGTVRRRSLAKAPRSSRPRPNGELPSDPATGWRSGKSTGFSLALTFRRIVIRSSSPFIDCGV